MILISRVRAYFAMRSALYEAQCWARGYAYADRALLCSDGHAYYKLNDECMPPFGEPLDAFDAGMRARLYEFSDGGSDFPL